LNKSIHSHHQEDADVDPNEKPVDDASILHKDPPNKSLRQSVHSSASNKGPLVVDDNQDNDF
jgi:hypothetical protein